MIPKTIKFEISNNDKNYSIEADLTIFRDNINYSNIPFTNFEVINLYLYSNYYKNKYKKIDYNLLSDWTLNKVKNEIDKNLNNIF